MYSNFKYIVIFDNLLMKNIIIVTIYIKTFEDIFNIKLTFYTYLYLPEKAFLCINNIE